MVKSLPPPQTKGDGPKSSNKYTFCLTPRVGANLEFRAQNAPLEAPKATKMRSWATRK